jgi:hypothetical protein
MAVKLHELRFVLSGGTSNVTPANSLGGQRSTDVLARVKSQSVSGITNVTGVSYIDAMSNAVGDGSLQYNASTNQLLWKGYGVGSYAGQTITGDGYYTIGASTGWLYVYVTQSSLPGTTQTDVVPVTNLVNNVWDNVTGQQAQDGLTEYRCLYVINLNSVDTAYDVRVWIQDQPQGPDSLYIALDPAGKGNGTTTGVAIEINSETDSGNELVGLTFTAPDTQSSALVIGNLTPGQCQAVWQQRVVSAGTTQQESNDWSRIGISALV